ncbi:MAG: L-2-hydroxyglutarate oxidase [Bacteroidota bacterium]
MIDAPLAAPALEAASPPRTSATRGRQHTVVIGAGIVGLATAYRLSQQGRRVTVVEKEAEVAFHQTGRNSGVLHSGIYYVPGSLKATTCRRGKAMMEAFCEAEQIPFERCGKVIVATRPEELPALSRIFERGKANGVTCEWINARRLREIEPHVAGIEAIHVPESGIVDYVAVCRRLAERIQEAGGDVRLSTRVLGLDHRASTTVVETDRGAVEAETVFNCAGLYSDRVAHMSGIKPPAQIVPFRGEYFELTPEAEPVCRGLIYPVPDPSFPFLGVHFTKMVNGGVECGPNAVLAFRREGYEKTSFDPAELAETLTYGGFLRLAAKYWRTGLGEMWRSASKRAFVRALQRLVPDIRTHHLIAAPAGVRAQALRPDGTLVDDFLVQPAGRVVNVVNAPSPAATAALAIAERLVG